MRLIRVFLVAIMVLAINSTAFAAITPEVIQTVPQSPSTEAETTSQPDRGTATDETKTAPSTGIDISPGVPNVTPEMLTKKINSMSDAIYGTARSSIAAITAIALIVGAIGGIVFKEARRMVGFAILALIIVLWAPQIIGFVINMTQF